MSSLCRVRLAKVAYVDPSDPSVLYLSQPTAVAGSEALPAYSMCSCLHVIMLHRSKLTFRWTLLRRLHLKAVSPRYRHAVVDASASARTSSTSTWWRQPTVCNFAKTNSLLRGWRMKPSHSRSIESTLQRDARGLMWHAPKAHSTWLAATTSVCAPCFFAVWLRV